MKKLTDLDGYVTGELSGAAADAFEEAMFDAPDDADVEWLDRISRQGVTLVEHGRAFATNTALPESARNLPMPAALREALRALDEQRLVAELGAWLDARQIRALLARRDRLAGGAAR